MFDLESFFRDFYERAERPEDLPWHSEQLPPLLDAFLDGRSEAISILDLGSGTGFYSVEMARLGHDVVGIDFVEKAVRMSQKRAEEVGVEVDFIQADAVDWEAPRAFDLVIDSGLFHGLSDDQRRRYQKTLLQRVKGGGDYFLSHFVARHPFDWRPVGPNRRYPGTIEALVPDEFTLRNYVFERVYPPFPVGPTARMGHFWFERPVQ